MEHAERRAQLKERLRQCKEDVILGMLVVCSVVNSEFNQAKQSLELEFHRLGIFVG